ncbi:ParB/RepB/Spo0J family partition protein [Cellulosimicrobium aquatile]|uniref:ParB/RepB/Spo0J family partition protein n=1 Tax=Cellulosimicrobium aquatile TaxID=1612203 RepID=UPI0014599613|nr:ParB/RepB/Spo0J family partition protein [Cellulosimicrobium aquatile]NMF27929.1 ParB/RepB/Spo0J family partition protein [Cellulosimicrobium aquatile]
MSPVIDLDRGRAETPATESGPLLDLPVTQIVQHPLNPSARSDVDEDLAADIRAAGEIYERLVVRPAPGQDGKYELLSGHRRFAAAQHLAMLFVPVRVVSMDDVAAATFLLRANQSRKDLTLVEEAVMVQGLLDLPDAPTQHALAESLGRSDTWVSRRAKIARKPEPVLSALAGSGSALTFDDVEVLDEFDESPDLQAKIAAAHGTHEWNYEVNQARQARRAAAFYSEAGEVLRKADVDVQDSPDAEVPDGLRHSDYLWEGSNAEKLVKKLGMGEGWWARPYRYQTGYTLWRPLTADELEEEARRDARDAEARAQRETEAAEREARERSEAALRAFAETTAALRNDFLLRVVNGKTLDRNRDAVAALVHFAADVAAGSLANDLALGGYTPEVRESLALWLGLDIESDDVEAELDTRLDKLPPTNLLLAGMASQVEPYITPSSWAYTTDDDSHVAAWYRLLVALGYEPSTVETEALAGRLPETDS